MAALNRRRQILDGALSCFTRDGYVSTTIDDIRLEAGASTGSLYHHFDGKESIAVSLYLDRLSAYEAGYAEVLRATDGAETGIRGVVAYHLSWAETHRDDARFLLGHADLESGLARTGELPEQNRHFYSEVRDWTKARMNEGSIRSLPGDLVYALWLGPSQELTRQWLAGRSKTRPTAVSEILSDTAWSALTTG